MLITGKWEVPLIIAGIKKHIRNTPYPARIIIIPLFPACVKQEEKMIGKSKEGY